jgi:hypothetical protein
VNTVVGGGATLLLDGSIESEGSIEKSVPAIPGRPVPSSGQKARRQAAVCDNISAPAQAESACVCLRPDSIAWWWLRFETLTSRDGLTSIFTDQRLKS